MKRENYINWDTLFINIAENASLRSKDPSTRNGAAIVKDNKIISIGYNGLSKGFNDDGIDISELTPDETFLVPKEGLTYDYWLRDNKIKHNWPIHAEMNAIVNAKCDLDGASLYLFSEKGYYPCNICAGLIAQSGIIEIVMKTAIKLNTDVYNWNASRHTLRMANVNIRILEQ